MRMRVFVEFPMYDEVDDAELTLAQRLTAAKECVQNAMLRVYEEGATHSLDKYCTIGPALVFGAREVHNNADMRHAGKALTEAVECKLREDELVKAKLAAESLLRRLAQSDMSALELDVAYATLDALVYPLTGMRVDTNLEERYARPTG